ncbi:phosphatidylglycerophosphatase [Flexibacterium corallicola]|uniref:phosphatidylglycerophosphatase n=1 Tax=Flexibacterium corallicola TaxID=3037259 RepID=UPI00286F3EC0|nr:phosphatidylglycerophosphatase [Pseudovibrio sp. M1P-2-3]
MSGNWIVLLGVAGLLNPIALGVGVWMGWHLDRKAKIFVIGFAAAAFSLFIEAFLQLVGVPDLFGSQAGALALFPFRFMGGAVIALIAFAVNTMRPKME